MRSSFGDPSFFQHHNFVCMKDGRQPVRNENRNLFALGGNRPDGVGDDFFCQRVQR